MPTPTSRQLPQSSSRPPSRFYMPPLSSKNSLYKLNHSQKTEDQSTRFFTSSSSSLLHPSSLLISPSSYFSPPPPSYPPPPPPPPYPPTSSFPPPPSSDPRPPPSAYFPPPSCSSLLFPPPSSLLLPPPPSVEVLPLPPSSSDGGRRGREDWIVKKIDVNVESEKNEFFLTNALLKGKFKINSLIRERISYFEKHSEKQVKHKLLSFPSSQASSSTPPPPSTPPFSSINPTPPSPSRPPPPSSHPPPSYSHPFTYPNSPSAHPPSRLPPPSSFPLPSSHKRYFLVVDNTLLQKKPKYVYLQVLFEKEAKAEFGKLKNLIGGYFHMNPAKIFLFFKNGDVVRKIIDLDREDSTIFLSANAVFQKLDFASNDKEGGNLSYNENIKIAFLLYVKQLEIPLRIVNKKEGGRRRVGGNDEEEEAERKRKREKEKEKEGGGREEEEEEEEVIRVKNKPTFGGGGRSKEKKTGARDEEGGVMEDVEEEEEVVMVKIRREGGGKEKEGRKREEGGEKWDGGVRAEGRRRREDEERRYVMSSEKIERVYKDLKRGNFQYGDVYEKFRNQTFDHAITPKTDRRSLKKERILRKFQSKRKFSLMMEEMKDSSNNTAYFKNFREGGPEEEKRKDVEGGKMEEGGRKEEEGRREEDRTKEEGRKREEDGKRKEEEERKWEEEKIREEEKNKRIREEERRREEEEGRKREEERKRAEREKMEDEEDLEKMADKLDVLIEKWSGIKKNKVKKEGVEFEDVFEKKRKHIDFVEKNKRVFMNRKSIIGFLQKKNKELFLQNIPKMMQETHLSRKELHSIYILYKVLQEVTSQKYVNYNLDDGLDYNSFKTGIYQVFLQSEEMSKRIFKIIDYNFSGFLNWSEFLQLMVSIRTKSIRERIDLFIQIADRDQNGQLSRQEVFDLCKICLEKFIKEDSNDPFLTNLCDYFTRLIFNSVNVGLDKEISLKLIKKKILEEGEESNLLAMFCGADI